MGTAIEVYAGTEGNTESLPDALSRVSGGATGKNSGFDGFVE